VALISIRFISFFSRVLYRAVGRIADADPKRLPTVR
jgi:hypothetical protein